MNDKFNTILIDNRFLPILEKMSFIAKKNRNAKKHKRAFANVALIFDDNFNEISSTNNHKWDKTKYPNKFMTHAESILIDEIGYENCENMNIIISMPPCSHCYQRIVKGKFKSIYFISDHDQTYKIPLYKELIPYKVKTDNRELSEMIIFIKKVTEFSINSNKQPVKKTNP